MDGLELTPRELLFAARRLGAKAFFGLPDPFSGMDESDIAHQVANLPLALEQKGYASMGFDDAFCLTAGAEALISVCALCDTFITVDVSAGGRARPREVFYLRDGRAVRLRAVGEQLALTHIEPGAIGCALWEILQPPEQGPAAPEAFSVALSCLKQAQAAQDEAQALAALEAEGCPTAAARLLLEGLWGRAQYCAVGVTHVRRRSYEHVICIQSSRGCVRLTPRQGDDPQRWMVSPLDSAALRGLLRRLCDWENAEKEGEPA